MITAIHISTSALFGMTTHRNQTCMAGRLSSSLASTSDEALVNLSLQPICASYAGLAG